MIIAGNKIYDHCGYCGRLVCLNKFILGSIHICLSAEERQKIDRAALPPQQRPLGKP